MSKLELIDTVSFPAYALCALFNGDYSGLDSIEIAHVIDWEADYLNATFNAKDESFFSPSPEFGLACDCVELEIWSKTQ